MDEIDAMFEQIRQEGAEELRNEASILIEEAMNTAWPEDTPKEKLEARWFIEGLKYSLALVNYCELPPRFTRNDGE
jgi:hypothetical protein